MYVPLVHKTGCPLRNGESRKGAYLNMYGAAGRRTKQGSFPGQSRGLLRVSTWVCHDPATREVKAPVGKGLLSMFFDVPWQKCLLF